MDAAVRNVLVLVSAGCGSRSRTQRTQSFLVSEYRRVGDDSQKGRSTAGGVERSSCGNPLAVPMDGPQFWFRPVSLGDLGNPVHGKSLDESVCQRGPRQRQRYRHHRRREDNDGAKASNLNLLGRTNLGLPSHTPHEPVAAILGGPGQCCRHSRSGARHGARLAGGSVFGVADSSNPVVPVSRSVCVLDGNGCNNVRQITGGKASLATEPLRSGGSSLTDRFSSGHNTSIGKEGRAVTVAATRMRTTNPRTAQASTIDLRQVHLAPVIVIHGGETAVGDRIVTKVRELARQENPGTELTEITPSTFRPGLINMLTAPSLFEEHRMLIIDGAEQADQTLLAEILAYWEAPADDVILLIRHRGGQKNRQILTQAKRTETPIYWATKPRNVNEIINLVKEEAREKGGTISDRAAQGLVAAIGTDLNEILGTTRQLLADHAGKVGEVVVENHFVGRIDAGGFKIADALADGHGPEALVLTRRAFASTDQTNREPVVIVAALARKFRDLAKVTTPRLNGKELGMAPWQVNKVRAQAKKWDQDGIGRAICLVAQADADVKGASRDPEGAVEKCIIEISRVHSERRSSGGARRSGR